MLRTPLQWTNCAPSRTMRCVVVVAQSALSLAAAGAAARAPGVCTAGAVRAAGNPAAAASGRDWCLPECRQQGQGGSREETTENAAGGCTRHAAVVHGENCRGSGELCCGGGDACAVGSAWYATRGCHTPVLSLCAGNHALDDSQPLSPPSQRSGLGSQLPSPQAKVRSYCVSDGVPSVRAG